MVSGVRKKLRKQEGKLFCFFLLFPCVLACYGSRKMKKVSN